jgi:hypothetical protein
MRRCGTRIVGLGICVVTSFVSASYVVGQSPVTAWFVVPALGGLQDAANQPDLPAMARAAKSQFRPLTKVDLQNARAGLDAAISRLDERLAKDGENGKIWRAYLRLDDLKAKLQQANPDVAGLNAVFGKFSAGHNGLELVWFVDVRQALRHYLEVAGGVDNPGVKAAYEAMLDRLAGQLETYAVRPTPSGATDISESIAWLESAGQAQALLQAIRARYVYPNFCGRFAVDVLGAGIAGPVDETEPVDDVILGTIIHGVGRTVGRTSVALPPNPSAGVFDTILLATNHSQNVGRNGPVCIYSCGTTGVGAAKRFWIDGEGMHALPAVSNAAAHATITGIEAQRQIIERIAWRKANKQQSEAECIASRHAEQRVNRRIDEQAAPMIDRANRDYEAKVRVPLSNRNAFPQQTAFSTTSDFLELTALEAGANQLAAPTAPPRLGQPADIAVQIHESTINNAAATVLSGMVLREEMLQSAIKDTLGYVPEQLKPDPTKDQEPWTIVFARREPMTVAFAEDGFQFTLRGREFFKGERGYPGMNVTAVYKFVKTDQGVKAVRQGEIQVLPPGFDPASGKRLSVPQQAIRTLLIERLGKVFQTELTPQGFTMQGKWAAAGKFVPVEMNGRHGWLVIGWRRAGTPTAAASR